MLYIYVEDNLSDLAKMNTLQEKAIFNIAAMASLWILEFITMHETYNNKLNCKVDHDVYESMPKMEWLTRSSEMLKKDHALSYPSCAACKRLKTVE